MDLGLVPLALLMAAVTYPWRALPLLSAHVHRLPPMARDYLRLVGPAMLATLAAVNLAVVVDPTRTVRTFHIGIEWLAVGLCVASRRRAAQSAGRLDRRRRSRRRRAGDVDRVAG